ncbi:hypothetical protein OIO90_003223 [Microbotryomycetes sp. JL221]|nr:hypothetical protein OIO90_003223 [Microbotryomycetes sp. JL221]
MPANSARTKTEAQPQQEYTLPLVGARTPPPQLELIKAPLQPTNALSHVKRVQLTPAIGVEFDQELQLKQVLNLSDKQQQLAILKDLAYNISFHGVAFFKAQDELEPTDLTKLALLLGEATGKPQDSHLHIHPTQELGEDGLPLGKIDNKADKEGRQISFKDGRSAFSSTAWHTDVSFEPRPALYSLLRMHTLPSTGGDTLWSSAYSHYDALSPAMKQFLSGLTAEHDAEIFREQSRLNGYKLRTAPRGAPENSGDAFKAVHPLIRTNPTTGLQGLFVNRTFTTRIKELSFDESAALLQYLFRLQHENHDAQVRYRWSKNDLAIWDNRSTLHAATFDYDETRQGDRAVVVGEAPYFDSAGVSRRELLSRQA